MRNVKPWVLAIHSLFGFDEPTRLHASVYKSSFWTKPDSFELSVGVEGRVTFRWHVEWSTVEEQYVSEIHGFTSKRGDPSTWDRFGLSVYSDDPIEAFEDCAARFIRVVGAFDVPEPYVELADLLNDAGSPSTASSS